MRCNQQDLETMTKITFVQQDGERIETEGQNGATVMETAIMNGIPGIVAECGGACTCATCHVYVDDAWTETVGGPSNMEEDMLDFAFDVREESRLSCQIRISDKLDGLVVKIECTPGVKPVVSTAAAEILKLRVKERIGTTVDVEIVPTGSLPRSEGKYKRVYDLRDQ